MDLPSLIFFSLCPLAFLLGSLALHRRYTHLDVNSYLWIFIAFLWGSIISPHGALLVVRAFGGLSGTTQSVVIGPWVEELFKCGGLLWICAAHLPTPNDRFWLGVALGVGFAVTENFLAFIAWQGPSTGDMLVYVGLRIFLPTLMHSLTAALQSWLPSLSSPHHQAARWLLLPCAAYIIATLTHALHNGVVFSLPSKPAVAAAVVLPVFFFYVLQRIYNKSLTQNAASTQPPKPLAR